jgi:hypothetical protein
VEADCHWCLTNLLAGIQDHYTSDQPGVQRMVMRLEELVTRIDANLTNYLKSVGIEFMQFSFKWMNCLLLREFNPKCVHRLWDTYTFRRRRWIFRLSRLRLCSFLVSVFVPIASYGIR